MANIKSAIKRARQAEIRRQHNVTIRSRVRTYMKKTDVAIEAGQKDEAQSAFKLAQSEMSRASAKGIFRNNKASRDISRLHGRLKAMA